MFKKINSRVIVGLSTTLLLINTYSFAALAQQPETKQIPQSGLQLWVNNCTRCHNMRPPESFSDAQWDVAVLHMRIRANLAADDARAIAKYLKSAN